jgi:hypothetical protein
MRISRIFHCLQLERTSIKFIICRLKHKLEVQLAFGTEKKEKSEQKEEA